MQRFYNFLLGSSVLLALSAIGVSVFGEGLSAAGIFVIGALICLAVGGAQYFYHQSNVLYDLGIGSGINWLLLPSLFSKNRRF